MDVKERFNSSAELYNAATAFFKYLTGTGNAIDRKTVKKTILALLSTYWLSLKEEIITKRENMEYESNLYSNSFQVMFEKIYKKIPEIVIDEKIADETTVFSIIRNKFAHGDFIYLEESNEIMFYSYGITFKLSLDDLFDFYFNMQNNVMILEDKSTYIREILYNKSKKNLTKKVETEKEVEELLKLFTLRRYYFKKMDNQSIPLVIKQTFDFAINQINQIMNRNEDTKNLEEEIRKIYEKQGYSLLIENKKIKDKQVIDKIKRAILTNKRLIKSDEPLEVLSYSYGETIKGILWGESKKGIIDGAITSLMILEEDIQKDEFLFQQRLLNGYNELIAGLLIARFNTLYCQPLDDLYKKDNNYHLNRNDILDFSLLNLDELKPNIIKLEKKGIVNCQKEIEVITKKIKLLDNCINKNLNVKKALERLKYLDERKQKVYDRACNIISGSQFNRNRLCELLYEKYLKLEEIKLDYKDNEKYFRNLAIIEGIRNSIAHGNVEMLNAAETDDFNKVKIRFNNIYKGEIVFQLTTTLYEFECLFEQYNIDILECFGKEKNLFKSR